MQGPYKAGQKVRVKTSEEIAQLIVKYDESGPLLPGGMHFYTHMRCTCGKIGTVVESDTRNPFVEFEGIRMYFMPDETIDPVDDES